MTPARAIVTGSALGLAAWAIARLSRARRESAVLAELGRLRAHRRAVPVGASGGWDLAIPGQRGARGESTLDVARRVSASGLRLIALRSHDGRLTALFALSPGVAETLDGADAASTAGIVRPGEAGILVLVPEAT